jgi:hypothetical protein
LQRPAETVRNVVDTLDEVGRYVADTVAELAIAGH